MKKTIIPLFLFSFILLVLVPVLGIEVKGAKRWIDLFFFRLQPIEIIKPFFVLITATIICRYKNKNINLSNKKRSQNSG